MKFLVHSLSSVTIRSFIGDEICSLYRLVRLVQEMARLFQSFADGSALEGITMKAAMLMPIQKTSFKSRSREDARVLGRQLLSWKRGDLESLLKEYRSIQEHLNSTIHHSADSFGKFACRFAKLMMEGKLRAATRLIEENADDFPLSLNTSVTVSGVTSTVWDILWRNILLVICQVPLHCCLYLFFLSLLFTQSYL